jgi:N,N-dimethylformamidase
MKTIMGYSDKISVCAGETIKFMVSCEEARSYKARLVQIIHGDTSPGGPGYKEKAVKADIEKDYAARKQSIHAGSHAIVPANRLSIS